MESLLGQCASPITDGANGLFVLLLQSLLTAHCSISDAEQWPTDYGSQALEKGLETYDFVVIGAGSAGSVVANRLSENPEWRVLVLEAGGDPSIESEVPVMYQQILNSSITWNYYAQKNEYASRYYTRGSYWPSGRALGGSAAVGSMIYLRGNPRDYEEWVEMGNEGWDPETVLRYYKKSEDMKMASFLRMNDGMFHSAGGELKISSFFSVEPLKNILIEAALERKHNEVIDINANEHLGFCILGKTLQKSF